MMFVMPTFIETAPLFRAVLTDLSFFRVHPSSMKCVNTYVFKCRDLLFLL